MLRSSHRSLFLPSSRRWGILSFAAFPARTFHTTHETPTDCSRRRKEADTSPTATFPPPCVGGYEACEISGLGVDPLLFETGVSNTCKGIV